MNMREKLKKAPSFFWISLFAASSGLTLSVGSSVIPAWLTSLGFDLTTIGLASLLGVPYLIKFLWAPFFDRYHFLNFPRIRGWLFLAHLLLAGFCLLLAFLPRLETAALLALFLLFGFCAASLDTLIDGQRTSLPDISASQKNAIYVFFYRVAMMLSGACLICADYFGWKIAYFSLTLYFLIGALCALKLPAESVKVEKHVGAFKAGWQDFLARQKCFMLLAFVLFYKMGIGFALSMGTPFLMRALHFSLTDIGLVLKGVGFTANIFGVFLGGYLMTRLPIHRSLAYFLGIETLAISLFIWMAYVPPCFFIMATVVGFEQFASGLATVALLTFIMQQVHPEFKNAQYALLTSIASFGRVLVAPLAGLVIHHIGWVGFYGLAMLLSLPAFFCLIKITPRDEANI